MLAWLLLTARKPDYAWYRRPAYGDAKAAALRALPMDASYADAHAVLAAVLLFSAWNWFGARRAWNGHSN